MITAEKITIRLDDWQKNAGIVGFTNIVGKENVEISDNEICFDSKLLENFSENYFNYFIETYKETLSWYKIVSYGDKIERYEQEDFKNFDEKALNELNSYIRDVAKYYLKSASYQSSYELINNDFDIAQAGTDLVAVSKIGKKETFEEKRVEIMAEVQSVIKELKEIIAYCNHEDGKKYLAAKNVIYTIIKNGWNGVSILNPQTKEKDVYIDFQNYFVEPLNEYLSENTEKYKYNCCSCNRPIKNYDDTLTFLNKTGFDTKKKNSHSWEFSNDLAICPVCKLMYACLPAGLIYVYGQGMFVNANSSVNELVRVNQQIKYEVFNLNRENLREMNTYGALVRAFTEQNKQDYELQLDDIQVVRYQNETYRFNILSKRLLKVMRNSDSWLSTLTKAGFKEGTDNYSVYQLVIERLFNSENMFTLIHKLLVLKATKVSTLYYQLFQVENIIKINQEFLGGIGVMDKLSQENLKKIKNSAWYFKKGYDNLNKVGGISYKLLSALKINNRDEFMNIILNCYAYLNKQVPDFFNLVFKDEETFKTVGYCFVSGIIGPVMENEGGNNNEN